jgi:hypothetical protein
MVKNVLFLFSISIFFLSCDSNKKGKGNSEPQDVQTSEKIAYTP